MKVKTLTGILVFKTATEESKENIIWHKGLSNTKK